MTAQEIAANVEEEKKEAAHNQILYHDAVQRRLCYVRDRRTGLCFAVWGSVGGSLGIGIYPMENSALTEVPCSQKVMALIKIK